MSFQPLVVVTSLRLTSKEGLDVARVVILFMTAPHVSSAGMQAEGGGYAHNQEAL